MCIQYTDYTQERLFCNGINVIIYNYNTIFKNVMENEKYHRTDKIKILTVAVSSESMKRVLTEITC